MTAVIPSKITPASPLSFTCGVLPKYEFFAVSVANEDLESGITRISLFCFNPYNLVAEVVFDPPTKEEVLVTVIVYEDNGVYGLTPIYHKGTLSRVLNSF